MRRLDNDRTLERLLMAGRLTPRQLNPLAALLTRFYRRAPRVATSPAAHLQRWRRGLAANRSLLFDPRLGLPAALVRRIDRRQREFLRHHANLLQHPDEVGQAVSFHLGHHVGAIDLDGSRADAHSLGNHRVGLPHHQPC